MSPIISCKVIPVNTSYGTLEEHYLGLSGTGEESMILRLDRAGLITFIVSLNTAALLHRRPISTGTYRDRFHIQKHHKRDTCI
jgi:hypothetical protein